MEIRHEIAQERVKESHRTERQYSIHSSPYVIFIDVNAAHKAYIKTYKYFAPLSAEREREKRKKKHSISSSS